MFQQTAHAFKYMTYPRLFLAVYRWGRNTRRALEEQARAEAAYNEAQPLWKALMERDREGTEMSSRASDRSDIAEGTMEKIEEDKKKKPEYNVIVFPRVTKRKLCFRECAVLIRIAEETECQIGISVGKLHGSTDSMLTLLRMKIREGTTMSVTIRGKDTYTAFHRCRDLFDDKEAEEENRE